MQRTMPTSREDVKFALILLLVIGLVLGGIAIARNSMESQSLDNPPVIASQVQYDIEVGDVYIFNCSYNAYHDAVVTSPSGTESERVTYTENVLRRFDITKVEYSDDNFSVTIGYDYRKLNNLSASDPNDPQWNDVPVEHYEVTITNNYNDLLSVPFAAPKSIGLNNFTENDYIFNYLLKKHFDKIFDGKVFLLSNVSIIGANYTHFMIPYIANFSADSMLDSMIVLHNAVNETYENETYFYHIDDEDVWINGTTSIAIRYYVYDSQPSLKDMITNETTFDVFDPPYDPKVILNITNFSSNSIVVYHPWSLGLRPNDIVRFYYRGTAVDSYIYNITYSGNYANITLESHTPSFVKNGSFAFGIEPSGDLEKIEENVPVENIFENTITIRKDVYENLTHNIDYTLLGYDLGGVVYPWRFDQRVVNDTDSINITFYSGFYDVADFYKNGDNVSFYRETPYKNESMTIEEFIKSMMFNITKDELNINGTATEFTYDYEMDWDIIGKMLVGEGIIGDGRLESESNVVINISDSHAIVYYSVSADIDLFASVEYHGQTMTMDHIIAGTYSASIVYPNITTGTDEELEVPTIEDIMLPMIGWTILGLGGAGGIAYGIGVYLQHTAEVCAANPTAKSVCKTDWMQKMIKKASSSGKKKPKGSSSIFEF